MIILKKLSWSNLFSYGEGNSVDLDLSPLTQIVGLNGHGKSSIALILEEVLYNKNSKGIKKADIVNRNNGAKSYTIQLNFEKDGSEYTIITVRGNTQTVQLWQDGEDISSHTATSTYKLIEGIIGYDHKTFTQIVYQSSSNSLEFLTATDGNRKKFLIDLLNLGKYTETSEIFKEAVKSLNTEITILNTKIHSIKTWISDNEKFPLNILEIKEVPEAPKDQLTKIAEVRDSIRTFEATNKKIAQNNKYKEILDSIILEVSGIKPIYHTEEYTTKLIEHKKNIQDSRNLIDKMSKLGSVCFTCYQDVDKDKLNLLLNTQTEIIENSEKQVELYTNLLEDIKKDTAEWDRKDKNTQLYEQYHSLYNPNMVSKLLDEQTLFTTLENLETQINKIEFDIRTITAANNKAIAHNAKVEVIKSQLEIMRKDILELTVDLNVLMAKLSILQILVKTFSPTGLVAYKIECLVKDLEEVTNKYLAELSDGRFQLGFRVSGSDKLNVVITDNGRDIEILALSGGERARVNCATLLGIRKLMQSLSNTRINLLILDETIENLDIEGKERLVEVLLAEEHLNTFIISHGFSHPLLEKIQVVKHNNISRIE